MRLLIASVAALAAVTFAAPSFAQEVPADADSRRQAQARHGGLLQHAEERHLQERLPQAGPCPGHAHKAPAATTKTKAKKLAASRHVGRSSAPPARPPEPAPAPAHVADHRRSAAAAEDDLARRAASAWWAAGAVISAESHTTVRKIATDVALSSCPLSPTRESDVTHSAALISTEDLARRLGAPGLRLFDCTTYLRPRTDGQPGYISESGRANYDKGHIPGAAFLDLAGDLSVTSSKLRFTLPPLDELTKAFAAKGIGHGTFVVLYSHATPTWATRIWWMLRAVGFDDAAILDGGLDKWKAENRPLSTEPTAIRPPRSPCAAGRRSSSTRTTSRPRSARRTR